MTQVAETMELEAELDCLYRRPLAEFIAARNELAKRLRWAGDREAADRIKVLTKPSLTAWAVNQLHFRAPEELERLTAAGEELRAAHLAGGEAHRAAIKARREVITRLLALAEGILEEAGHAPSRAHRQRISRTLEALAGGGGTAGRLGQDLEPPGFDALSSLAAALPAVPRPPAVSEAEEPPPAAERRREGEPEVVETVDLIAERQRRRELERVERQLAAARTAVGEAEAKVAGLAGEAADRRERHAAAEDASAAASAAAEEAERRAREAREKAREARDAVAKARLEAAAADAAHERAAGELEAARKKLEELESERQLSEIAGTEDR